MTIIQDTQKERKALGKGLSALISDYMDLDGENDNNAKETYIDLDSIKPNPYQPRYDFDALNLEELKDSIIEFGVLQPILVKRLDGGYQLIAGERRMHAAKLAGLRQIPAIIKDIDDLKTMEMALVENIQRQNLSPLEEALAFERFIHDFGYTHDLLAKKISKSRSYITNTIRLLSLPNDVKELIKQRRLTAGHARAILNVPNPSELAQIIIDKNLSVRETEDLVKKQNIELQKDKGGATRESSPRTRDDEIATIEKTLSELLNLEVSITKSGEKGKILIKFNNLEELDSLIQLIGGDKFGF